MLKSFRHVFFLSSLAAAAAGCSKSEGAAPKAAPLAQEAAPVTDTVATDRLIVPEHSVGAITETTQHEMLAGLFPGAQLTYTNCSLAQEEESLCTRIAFDGKDALLVVYGQKRTAEQVYVFSDRFATKAGVRVGMTLDELVARNDDKPVMLARVFVIQPDGEAVDGWTVDDFGDGPLRDLGLTIGLAVPAATVSKLGTMAVIPSTDARLGNDGTIRVTSMSVDLFDRPPGLTEEGGDEGGDEGEEADEYEGEDLTEDEGEDPVPTVNAELPAAAGDVRSVPWSKLLYDCPTDCSPTFQKVIYGDVEGDGQEEAVVVTTPGILRGVEDETANLYGLRDGKVVWLGRVQESGYEGLEYSPTFVSAKLGRGTVTITWRYHLSGAKPTDALQTRVETFAIRGGVTQRIAATEK